MLPHDLKFQEHPDWPREPSVPLSAIRALIQQWEDDLIDIRKYAEDGVARADELQRCIDQLAALCPAPPEDQ